MTVWEFRLGGLLMGIYLACAVRGTQGVAMTIIVQWQYVDKCPKSHILLHS